MHDEKEIKYRIRKLKRLKKRTEVGSPTRRDLNKKIRELQVDLEKFYGDMTPRKKELVAEIYRRKPQFKKLKIDLRKFTEEQLELHLHNMNTGKYRR